MAIVKITENKIHETKYPIDDGEIFRITTKHKTLTAVIGDMKLTYDLKLGDTLTVEVVE